MFLAPAKCVVQPLERIFGRKSWPRAKVERDNNFMELFLLDIHGAASVVLSILRRFRKKLIETGVTLLGLNGILNTLKVVYKSIRR
jgi:hypothetical protein